MQTSEYSSFIISQWTQKFTPTNLKMLVIRSICTVYWFEVNCCEDPACCAAVTTCCQNIQNKIRFPMKKSLKEKRSRTNAYEQEFATMCS